MKGTEEFWSFTKQRDDQLQPQYSSTPDVLPSLYYPGTGHSQYKDTGTYKQGFIQRVSNVFCLGTRTSSLSPLETCNPWHMKQKNEDSGHSSLGSDDVRREYRNRRHSTNSRSQDVLY